VSARVADDFLRTENAPSAKQSAEDTAFRAALEKAAAKCGCDIGELRWEPCTIDRTWGDRVGRVFFGASDEVNKRAADFFFAWRAKQKHRGCYDAQNSLSLAGKFTFLRFSNGADGWYRGVREPGEPTVLESGFVIECVERREGYAVSTTYYPCAD
jgi:hypothetical protein